VSFDHNLRLELIRRIKTERLVENGSPVGPPGFIGRSEYFTLWSKASTAGETVQILFRFY
jgi:hypothetical protein